MSDSVKKKRKKFKKSTQAKKKSELDAQNSQTQIDKRIFLDWNFHHFSVTRRTIFKFALFLLPLNFILLFSVIYLYQKSIKPQKDITVLGSDVFVFPEVKDPKNIFVSTPSYIVYEVQSRVVVSEKNSDLRFSPASSAKIMTALVAMDYYDTSQTLKVPSLASVEGSNMGLFENEEIKIENLLYGLMLPSGNDAAYTLAVNYKSGYEDFVEAMNEKAKLLKLENTLFTDPAGFEDSNYTTAYDMARLGAYAISNTEFAKIVSTKNIIVSDITGKFTHELSNLNELLGINGVDGIKTGFTEEAGGVLVTSVLHEGRHYIIVLFKSDDRFADTRSILESIISSIRLIRY